MKTGSRLISKASQHRPASLGLLLATFALAAGAQLATVPDTNPQQLFGGDARQIAVRWKNAGPANITVQVHTRLFQASSATAAPLGDWSWKQLEVLPGQTVLESASLPLPSVRAETRCLVQWMCGSNIVLGTTELLVYPTNLLTEFGALADGHPLGLFDPQNELKPLLKSLAVDFSDLENTGIAGFIGKLAIIGPFASAGAQPDDLIARLKTAAGKGASILWIQPPPNRAAPLRPSFRIISQGKGTILVAQEYLVANLAQNPRSQMNLVELARIALRPAPADCKSAIPSRFGIGKLRALGNLRYSIIL